MKIEKRNKEIGKKLGKILERILKRLDEIEDSLSSGTSGTITEVKGRTKSGNFIFGKTRKMQLSKN